MDLLSFFILLLISFIIGTVAEKVTPFDMPGSWAGAIVAGLIGAWLGPSLLGTFGPSLAGISIIPALIGAILVVVALGLLNKVIK